MSYRAPDRDYIWLDPAMNVLKNCVEGIWKPIATNISYQKVENLIIEQQKLNLKLDKKQDALVSGVNIKTINGKSVLGKGDVNPMPEGGWQIADFSTETQTIIGRANDVVVLDQAPSYLAKIGYVANIPVEVGKQAKYAIYEKDIYKITDVVDPLVRVDKFATIYSLDGTLTKSEYAANAYSVGEALSHKADASDIPTTIKVANIISGLTSAQYNEAVAMFNKGVMPCFYDESKDCVWQTTQFTGNGDFYIARTPIDEGKVTGATLNVNSFATKAEFDLKAIKDKADAAATKTDIAQKQDKLIAGSGITIAEDGKTISATGGGGDKPKEGWAKTDLTAEVQTMLDMGTWASNKINYNGLTALSVEEMKGQEVLILAGKVVSPTWDKAAEDATLALDKYAMMVEVVDKKADMETVNVLKDDINDKVDKVSGKGLSSNDYTDEEKTKLSNLTNDIDDLKANKVNTVSLAFQEGDTFSITGKDIFSYGPYTIPHYRLVDVDDEEYEYGAGRYLVFCLNHIDGVSPEESVRSYALYKETGYPEFSFCCLYDWGDYDSIPQWVLCAFDDDLRGEINIVKSEVTSVQSDLENLQTTVSTDCTKYCLFDDIDTLLGSTIAEVMASLRTQNAMRYVVQYKYASKQIIPVGIIEMFTDCMRHCVTQIFKTNYAITAAGVVDPNTHSHVLREYVRYYNVAWGGTDYYGDPWPIGTWTIWHEHNNTEIPLNMEVTYEDDTTETFVIYGKKVVED